MADDTDYYAGEDQAAPDTAPDNAPDGSPKGKEDDDSAGNNSGLLAKSLFGDSDPEVGSEVTFRVVHIYGDEVEVEPVTGEDNEKKSASPAMDEAEDKLGSMATMNGAATS